MIAIIDYGAGNLGSVYKAFRHLGTDVQVTSDAATVAQADHLVLPGVGAFTHCMQGLEGVGLTEATHAFIRTGRPFLGICVGLQMLFDTSEERGASAGLGLLPGRVVKFRFDQGRTRADERRTTIDEPTMEDACAETLVDRPALFVDRLKVPHIGWNALTFHPEAPLFTGLNQGDRVYFVHSYYPEPADSSVITATTEYGYDFCCAVQQGNIHATQFHPEKSGAVGLQILRNFADLPA